MILPCYLDACPGGGVIDTEKDGHVYDPNLPAAGGGGRTFHWACYPHTSAKGYRAPFGLPDGAPDTSRHASPPTPPAGTKWETTDYGGYTVRKAAAVGVLLAVLSLTGCEALSGAAGNPRVDAVADRVESLAERVETIISDRAAGRPVSVEEISDARREATALMREIGEIRRQPGSSPIQDFLTIALGVLFGLGGRGVARALLSGTKLVPPIRVVNGGGGQ